MAMEEEEEEVLWQERLLYIAGLLLSGAEMEWEVQLLRNPRVATPWRKLFHSQNNRAFFATMGFDVATFLVILGHFAEEWDTTPIPHNNTSSVGEAHIGRCSLDAAGALGLVLHYLNSTMRDIPEAKIAWPGEDKMEEYAKIIGQQHPALLEWKHGNAYGAFGSVDGLKLTVAATDNPEWENATYNGYNGWLHSHCCNNVLVFSPRGEITAAQINAPGSWHDSHVAKSIYQNLHDHTSDGYYLVADTAFPCGTEQIDRKIKAPLKSGQWLPLDTQGLNQLLHLNRQLLSYCQMAEWGMCALQGSFSCLRLSLDANNNQALEINQIKNVYEPIFKEAEGADMWEGFENMMYGTVINRDRVSRFHIVVVEQE
ncbi:hypothetical protein M422DRAFT_60318 [Sphaerobolus stellatus SS14]|uniref:DDE Tnp4 domain-containing protein n=1 Tax=Sphaerobolus stellatus (strain SS14) TaxID=990650 RepID=A0A0C9VYC7_SPHS4|nr:hypothetical protein M422DRAFT_60318 [Sphaerobolus stellatus SS14]